MSRGRKAEPKPLSFSTTMRNPMRIVNFLNCLAPFEEKILTHEVIMQIVEKIIKNKLYRPYYVSKVDSIRQCFDDEDLELSQEQVLEIIRESPQNHKEAGFAKGWDSRFDTWYKLPMEFGFVYYEMNKPIKISKVGHMLIDAFNEETVNEEKIQNVFLNSMMKYQSNNPFRKNANSNVPLILLLQVIKMLKEDPEENNAGVFRQELSLFICWRNNDSKSLYQKIKEIRKKRKYTYSDEYMYDICLDLLGAGEEHKNRFKISQICGEAVDEYIRKMRSTGIISLRGNGRFLDFNMIEEEKINYVLKNYSTYEVFTDKRRYFEYMGEIDNNIVNISKSTVINIDDLRKKTLIKYSKHYSKEDVARELIIVCSKRESRDPLLRIISGPARLEFLTSIALVQQFEGLDVNPNYIVDDEGLPTGTALGGMADIVCYDSNYDSLVEVTLMLGRQQQINNEMLPISRHLSEAKKNKENTFSVFVAPKIHEDVKRYIGWIKITEDLDVIAYDIVNFIEEINKKEKIEELLIS